MMEEIALNSSFQGSNSLPAHVLFIEPSLVPPQGTFYVLQPQCLLDSRNISGNFDGIPLESGKFYYCTVVEVVECTM
jgi:hypothetical protein